jgi:hypothetical protein
VHLQVEIYAEDRLDGIYLHIFHGEAFDLVGPLSRDGNIMDTKFTAHLDYEPPKGPRPPSERMRKRAKRTELEIAEDIGGKAQKASGALPWAKGDVRKRGEHRIEAKTTKTKSYHVTRKELDKIRGECAYGEKPAFVISFVNPGTLREEDKWVLQPYGDWHAANVNSRSGSSGSSGT